jgi:adenylate cyclase class 2
MSKTGYMHVINIEIKARCFHPDRIREVLKSKNARFKGKDHQVDTYFRVKEGRLKLREGDIENNLIFYKRDNIPGPKLSECQLLRTKPDSRLKKILTDSLGILAIVDKQREIYYIGNIKMHIDHVAGLGNFVEIEASGEWGEVSREGLFEQCKEMMRAMQIDEADLVNRSYSDLIMDMTRK